MLDNPVVERLKNLRSALAGLYVSDLENEPFQMARMVFREVNIKLNLDSAEKEDIEFKNNPQTEPT